MYVFCHKTRHLQLKRLLEGANGVVKVGFEREREREGGGELTEYELMVDEIDSI